MRICPAIAILCKKCRIHNAKIKDLNNLNTKIQERLKRLGICHGCPISLHHNTIFSDPIVFNINNSQIALRKKDVENIIIELD